PPGPSSRPPSAAASEECVCECGQCLRSGLLSSLTLALTLTLCFRPRGPTTMPHRTSRLSGLVTPRPALRTPAVTRTRPTPTLTPALPAGGVAERVKAAADFALPAGPPVARSPLLRACVV